MADGPGASFAQKVDSWSCTEVKSQKHSHIWTVKGFTQCDCRYLETTVTVKTAGPAQSQEQLLFRLGGSTHPLSQNYKSGILVVISIRTPLLSSAKTPNKLRIVRIRIRLHPQGNKESNRDFTFFQVFCSKNDVKYRAKFSVNNARSEEIATTVYSGQQQLHGYFEYIRRDLLINHLQPSDELQLLLDLNITFDTITRSSTTGRFAQSVCQEAEALVVAKDLEQMYKSQKMTDFNSPVFAAMLEHEETEEAQSNEVTIDDIDVDVVNEMLHYIYSGKSPNLKELASELLAVADRFALPGLKEMADQVLRAMLTIDTVCRILVLADLHGAGQLKQEAINFIAQNSVQVIDTDGWQQMVKQHSDLVTEVVSAIASGGASTDRSASCMGINGSEPALKRARFASVIFRQ